MRNMQYTNTVQSGSQREVLCTRVVLLAHILTPNAQPLNAQFIRELTWVSECNKPRVEGAAKAHRGSKGPFKSKRAPSKWRAGRTRVAPKDVGARRVCTVCALSICSVTAIAARTCPSRAPRHPTCGVRERRVDACRSTLDLGVRSSVRTLGRFFMALLYPHVCTMVRDLLYFVSGSERLFAEGR